jgi:hypothetical protein
VGNKEKIVGLGILSVLAFMHFRSKGINTILENKFDAAINVEAFIPLISDTIDRLKGQISTQAPFTDSFGRRCTSSSCRRDTDNRARNNANLRTTIAELVIKQQELNPNEVLIL